MMTMVRLSLFLLLWSSCLAFVALAQRQGGTMYVEEVCVPGQGRCLSEIISMDAGSTDYDDSQVNQDVGATISTTTIGGPFDVLGGILDNLRRDALGGQGAVPEGDEAKRTEDDETGEEEGWGTEDDLARQAEEKKEDASRMKQKESSGIYTEKIDFQGEDEDLSVIRRRDSRILKRIQDMFGDTPATHDFLEARENIINTRRQVRNMASSLNATSPGFAVTETIRGSSVGGRITFTEFDLVHSARAGPIETVPLSTISDILIGTSGKKRGTQTFGILNHLFGVAGNYPVHFRKVVDQSSPFFMQAAADFDPVGTHRFKNPSDRRCPHLFNLQLTISLSSNKPNFDLQLTFVDAVITDYTIVSPDPSSNDPRPFEDIYFMYRGLMYAVIDSFEVKHSGSFTNGFRDGVPPIPIPGGDEGCCEELPWAIQPGPDCTLYEMDYPISTTISI